MRTDRHSADASYVHTKNGRHMTIIEVVFLNQFPPIQNDSHNSLGHLTVTVTVK